MFIHLAMDLSYGAIYCFSCKDYVYDNEVDALKRDESHDAITSLNLKTQHWQPSTSELEILKEHPKRKKICRDSYIGNYFNFDCINPVLHHFCYRTERADKLGKYLLHELHCSGLDAHAAFKRLLFV